MSGDPKPKVPDNSIGISIPVLHNGVPARKVLWSERCRLPALGPVLDPDRIREARVLCQSFAEMSGLQVVLKLNGKVTSFNGARTTHNPAP